MSILLYGGTIWTLMKSIGKKLDGNNARILQAVLNKSWSNPPPDKIAVVYHPSKINKTLLEK